MSIEGLVVALALLMGAALWVGAPLLRRQPPKLSGSRQQERLLMYYERVLTNIRDLDEDHATGKLNTADYEVEREQWILRGVEILKALDNLHDVPAANEAAVEETIDDEIEAAIAAYRRTASQPE